MSRPHECRVEGTGCRVLALEARTAGERYQLSIFAASHPLVRFGEDAANEHLAKPDPVLAHSVQTRGDGLDEAEPLGPKQHAETARDGEPRVPSSPWWKSAVAQRAAMRPADKARRPRIPGVFEEGATQSAGMQRRPNAGRVSPRAAGHQAPPALVDGHQPNVRFQCQGDGLTLGRCRGARRGVAEPAPRAHERRATRAHPWSRPSLTGRAKMLRRRQSARARDCADVPTHQAHHRRPAR